MKKVYGIIEGYYGKPWNSSDRKRIIQNIARWGFNSYFYGPKDDPYHRILWRESYPEALEAEIVDLYNYTNNLNIDFYFLVSPGNGLTYSSEDDLNLLLKKIFIFYKYGIRKYGISFDDISLDLRNKADQKKYSNIESAQNDFLIKLYKKLKDFDPEISLVTCPTEYSGRGDSVYIKRFCKNLPEDLLVFWTGREVCSNSLSAPDTDYFIEKNEHRPLYWDNYPVNDVVMKWEMHLGPYDKRDSDILNKSDGIVLNVMDFPDLSLIALKTASDFFKEKENYNAQVSWEKAIEEIIPASVRDSFRAFALYNYKSCIYPYFSNLLLVKEFMKNMGDPDWDYRKYLSNTAKEGLQAEKILLANRNIPIISESLPWIKKYGLLMRIFACYGKVESGNPLSRWSNWMWKKNLEFRFQKNKYEIFQLEFFDIFKTDKKAFIQLKGKK